MSPPEFWGTRPAIWRTSCLRGTHDTDDGPYVRWDELTLWGQREFRTNATISAIETTVTEEALLYELVNTSGTAQANQDLAKARAVADRAEERHGAPTLSNGLSTHYHRQPAGPLASVHPGRTSGLDGRGYLSNRCRLLKQ